MSPPSPAVTFVGVRHHSPACARLVQATIERERPRSVLIEGPADMDGRIGELQLEHEPPLAVFTYASGAGRSQSTWSPFCSHSPEWVALRTAFQAGARARFVDLPAWDPAFQGVHNRYSDRPDRHARIVDRLIARFGLSDLDALWEHLFEQPLTATDLAVRLRLYFEELRGGEPADARDAPREDFMARAIGSAAAEGSVVVVCGGWHAPALERAWRAHLGAPWPRLPDPPDGTRVGSYLVPYSFRRLDSFAGYESGMPSPAYQDAAFREGAAQAAELLLARTVARLRQRRQGVSAADMIAARAMSEGLRRLRGHTVTTRLDLLDGLAAGLLKDALDVPLPWSYRGPLLPRTDPLLVEIVDTFAGDRVGRLAPGTPHPPLLHEARAQLEAHDLAPRRVAREVCLELTQAPDVERSRVLHRLRVLGIPGFTRSSGPTRATEGVLAEAWRVEEKLDAEPALIEAAAYGATLETAAAGRLEEALLNSGGQLGPLSQLLGEAVFVGIATLAERLLHEVATRVGGEPSLRALGDALGHLLGLWRHDRLLGSAGAPGLGAVIEAAFSRGLWLVEGVQGNALGVDEGHLRALVALRDTLRHGERRLGLDRTAALAVMERRCSDAGAPFALRGGALGFLWSGGGDAAPENLRAVTAVRRAARPETLGDFLAGLFALAREEARQAPGLLGAIDETLAALTERDFLVALPSLRLAFAFFPPAEREQIAAQVLAVRGGDPAESRLFLRLDADPATLAVGRELEAQVDDLLRRHGLEP